MIFDYQEICEDLLQDLPNRARSVMVKRFGLKNGQKETLQIIGSQYGVSRERIRQIEKNSFSKLKSGRERHKRIFDFFFNQLKTSGNLRMEEALLKILSPGLFKNHVFFLLSLDDGFERILGGRDFYTFWTIDKNSFLKAQKIIEKSVKELERKGQPVRSEEIESFLKTEPGAIFAFLEISKKIQKGPQGLWGLTGWSEINPRGIRDKAYIIFKKEKRPLHFNEVAQLIDESNIFDCSRKTHPQTVHNELIKDSHFVLIGRGIYALKEWGYQPGVVKDVIIGILKEVKAPLTREEIIEKVLKQRLVRKNTILLNLRDGRYFARDLKGRYGLKKI